MAKVCSTGDHHDNTALIAAPLHLVQHAPTILKCSVIRHGRYRDIRVINEIGLLTLLYNNMFTRHSLASHNQYRSQWFHTFPMCHMLELSTLSRQLLAPCHGMIARPHLNITCSKRTVTASRRLQPEPCHDNPTVPGNQIAYLVPHVHLSEGHMTSQVCHACTKAGNLTRGAVICTSTVMLYDRCHCMKHSISTCLVQYVSYTIGQQPSAPAEWRCQKQQSDHGTSS